MRITEHKDHLVEYETDAGYISVVKTGNLFALGINWQGDELEEFLTETQASHLMAWLSKHLVNTSSENG